MEKEYTIDLKAVGERLKQVRIENNLKQSEMAEILGLGRTIISTMEKGDSSPTLQSLFILKEKFNISIDWLISGKTGMEHIPGNEEATFKLLIYYLQNFGDFREQIMTDFMQTWKPLIDAKLLENIRSGIDTNTNEG